MNLIIIETMKKFKNKIETNVLKLIFIFLLFNNCTNSTQKDYPQKNYPKLQNSFFIALNQGISNGQLPQPNFKSESKYKLRYEIIEGPKQGVLILINPETGRYKYNHQTKKLNDFFTFIAIHNNIPSNVATVFISVDDKNFSGSALYEQVSTLCYINNCHQDFIHTNDNPIRWAKVQIRETDQPENIIAETTTDNSGNFSFYNIRYSNVFIVILSESVNPPIKIVNNYLSENRDKPVYGLTSKPIDVRDTKSIKMIASTGYDKIEKKYTTEKSSAPFAILDTLIKTSHVIMNEVPNIKLPPLTVNWSEKNIPSIGNKHLGEISTSHWDGEEIYLLGDPRSDADEFDSDVIVHEWGHYFEDKLSRSDSIGGPHSQGDKLDMRVAFSEGFGNALSAIIGHPDTLYSDCSGLGGQFGFFFDIQKNSTVEDPKGWYSEISIQAILYDLWDDDSDQELFDGVSIPLSSIINAFIGDYRSNPALTSIFSYISNLKNIHQFDERNIEQLMLRENIEFNISIYGENETNNGGDLNSLPIYKKISLNNPIDLTFSTYNDPSTKFSSLHNKMVANKYVLINNIETNGFLEVKCNKPTSLLFYNKGKYEYFSTEFCSISGCSTILISPLKITPSETYIINLISELYQEEDYSCNLTLF